MAEELTTLAVKIAMDNTSFQQGIQNLKGKWKWCNLNLEQVQQA
ncbi:hypothetical protein [Caloramator sp. Dgby_cultured_2]|nr:hypothetical protein [Caloramator sp. Dgby_cultured_2]WDU84205.1 hypothetical protein PWK10_07760 [Caloramator sp. Dgby_cultured_2]